MNKFNIKRSRKGRKTVKTNLHFRIVVNNFLYVIILPCPVNIVGDVERICPHGSQSDGGDLVGDVPGVSEAGDQLELQEPGDVDHEAEEERGQGVHQHPGYAGARELQLAVGQGSKHHILSQQFH